MYHSMAMAGIPPMSPMEIIIWQFCSLLGMGLLIWSISRFNHETRGWSLVMCMCTPAGIMILVPVMIYGPILIPFFNVIWVPLVMYNQVIDPNMDANLARGVFSAMAVLMTVYTLDRAIYGLRLFIRRVGKFTKHVRVLA